MGVDLMIRTDNARIVNVSSTAHFMCQHFDLNDLNFDKNPATEQKILHIYAVTKLCNILFTKELASKLEPLGIYCNNYFHHVTFSIDFHMF